MGALCSKGNDVILPKNAQLQPAVSKSEAYLGPSKRESEKRGMRQGLVHSRPNASVWDYYREVKVVGHGMTGKVYMVQHKITEERFALKCMEMRKIDPELIQDLRNEIEVLKLQDHPNVIKLYEYYEDKDNLYLILEYADGGELFDRLHEQKGSRYCEQEAASLLFRMCAAIAYIHFMGVTHRDLKLENFIFESRRDDSNLKLIDFGLSSKYGSGASSMMKMSTMVGTPYYIAPEVLNQAENGQQGYTNACDCWSIGVIAYMLLSGTPPFKGRRDREVLQAVRRGKYTLSGPRWEGISENAKDFIRHLLIYNPAKRMSAVEALHHPFLAQARQEYEKVKIPPEMIETLRDYAKLSAIQRVSLLAVAFSVSGSILSPQRDVFSRIDRTQSGFIDQARFLDCLVKEGVDQKEAEFIFSKIDQDHSGVISYSEFLSSTLPRRFWTSKRHVRAAFDRFDVNNTGSIDSSGFKAVLGNDWSPELHRQLFGDILREINSKKAPSSQSSSVNSKGGVVGDKIEIEALSQWFFDSVVGICGPPGQENLRSNNVSAATASSSTSGSSSLNPHSASNTNVANNVTNKAAIGVGKRKSLGNGSISRSISHAFVGEPVSTDPPPVPVSTSSTSTSSPVGSVVPKALAQTNVNNQVNSHIEPPNKLDTISSGISRVERRRLLDDEPDSRIST